MNRQSVATRLIVACLILALVIVQAGCVTRPPSLDLHDRLVNERIALLDDPDNASLSLNLYAGNKPLGALKGAGRGIASFFGSVNPGNCSGEFCAAALLLYLAVAVVVGGTIGTIQGGMEAPSANTTAAIEDLFRNNLGEFAAHIDLPQRVLAQSRKIAGLSVDLVSTQGEPEELNTEALGSLKQQGYDQALTLKIDRFGFVGDKGDDPLLGLYIEVSARITDTISQSEMYHRRFHSFGKVRRYSEWVSVDAEMLSVEVNGYIDKLAEDIVNGLFLSYDLPIDSGSWTFPGSETYGCCWICPVNPALEINYFPHITQGWPTVSTKPQLAWRPFPNEQQQIKFQAKTGSRASNILYDLRIWSVPRQQLDTPTYERYAITGTTHQVEEALEPGRSYRWSVRACFDLAPRVACTPWAFCLVPAGRDACDSTSVSPENYYHFRVH